MGPEKFDVVARLMAHCTHGKLLVASGFVSMSTTFKDIVVCVLSQSGYAGNLLDTSTHHKA